MNTENLLSLLEDVRSALFQVEVESDAYICTDGYAQTLDDLLARVDEAIMVAEKELGK
jgi:hypothetical protein